MEDRLTDVREAFRYIFQYQRKILDSIRLLTSEYNLINGSPKFSKAPQLGTSFKFQNWSWDYLPFYQPAFIFDISSVKAEESSDSKNQDFNDYYTELAVYITSDTGHFINETEESSLRIDLNRFAPCDQSDSVVVLMIYAKDKSTWHERIGFNNSMINNKKKEDSLFIKDKVIARKYDLGQFKDEATIMNLREDFKKFSMDQDKRAKIF